MLKLPAWTDAQHPIGRYERLIWRKFLGRWWWLAALPIAFVLLTTLCSLASNLPVFIQLTVVPTSSASPELGLIAIGLIVQTLFQSVWNINTTIQWVIGVAIGFGSAVTIARERETKNWELLCLTPMTAGEIALAKTYTIVRQFLWPLVITTIVNIGLTLLLALVILAGLLLFNSASPGELPSAVINIIIALTLIATPVILSFLLLNSVLDVLNSLAVGLAASCWSKTRANAVALTIIANFILNIFILIPIYFVLFIGVAFIGGLITFLGISPVTGIVVMALVMAGLYVVFRAGTTVAAIAAARYQLNRLTE